MNVMLVTEFLEPVSNVELTSWTSIHAFLPLHSYLHVIQMCITVSGSRNTKIPAKNAYGFDGNYAPILAPIRPQYGGDAPQNWIMRC